MKQEQTSLPERPLWPAILRGWRRRCPNCGQGAMLSGFLKVIPQCKKCDTEFFHHRADDAPPYMTVFVAGHVVIPLMMVMEKWYHPPQWIHWTLWPALSLLLVALLLPSIKGALIGTQWALRMHGFEDASHIDNSVPRSAIIE